jgi:hypothetical protein
MTTGSEHPFASAEPIGGRAFVSVPSSFGMSHAGTADGLNRQGQKRLAPSVSFHSAQANHGILYHHHDNRSHMLTHRTQPLVHKVQFISVNHYRFAKVSSSSKPAAPNIDATDSLSKTPPPHRYPDRPHISKETKNTRGIPPSPLYASCFSCLLSAAAAAPPTMISSTVSSLNLRSSSRVTVSWMRVQTTGAAKMRETMRRPQVA